MALLRKLRERFSTTIQAWDRFDTPDGDIRYFSDISDISEPQAQVIAKLALNNIKEIFENLKDLEQTLTSLDKSCEEHSRVVG